MNIYTPKEKSMWPGFLAVVLPIFLIFTMVFGYFSLNKMLKDIMYNFEHSNFYYDKNFESLNQEFLSIYYSLQSLRDRLELIETVAPIYERRVSEIEDWKNGNCFVTCGKKP